MQCTQNLNLTHTPSSLLGKEGEEDVVGTDPASGSQDQPPEAYVKLSCQCSSAACAKSTSTTTTRVTTPDAGFTAIQAVAEVAEGAEGVEGVEGVEVAAAAKTAHSTWSRVQLCPF
eukprot:m.143119 g.143119  ORF g.143119 m.143119 type:complete len:116 (-) comp22962_c0_seq8:1493-1840(-)